MSDTTPGIGASRDAEAPIHISLDDEVEYPKPTTPATVKTGPKANAPKTQVIDRKLYFTPEPDFETGEQPRTIVVPLAMRTKTYRAMAEMTEGGMEQLYKFVFEPLGIASQVDELDMADTTILVNAWFEKFSEQQEADSLGE